MSFNLSFYIALLLGLMVTVVGIMLIVSGLRIFFKREVSVAMWRARKFISMISMPDQYTLTGWKKNLYGLGLIILGYLLLILK